MFHKLAMLPGPGTSCRPGITTSSGIAQVVYTCVVALISSLKSACPSSVCTTVGRCSAFWCRKPFQVNEGRFGAYNNPDEFEGCGLAKHLFEGVNDPRPVEEVFLDDLIECVKERAPEIEVLGLRVDRYMIIDVDDDMLSWKPWMKLCLRLS